MPQKVNDGQWSSTGYGNLRSAAKSQNRYKRLLQATFNVCVPSEPGGLLVQHPDFIADRTAKTRQLRDWLVLGQLDRKFGDLAPFQQHLS